MGMVETVFRVGARVCVCVRERGSVYERERDIGEEGKSACVCGG